MNVLVAVFFGFALVGISNAYVLMQVRKGEKDNTSNVDAFIHKEMPTEQLNELPMLHATRKQWPNYKRFEIRKRAEDSEERHERASYNLPKDLESVMVAVDTGAKTEGTTDSASEAPANEPDIIDKIEKVIKDIVKTPNNPIYRAQAEYNIKPQLIRIRSEQPVLKVDISSDSLVRAISDFLALPDVKKYADVAGRKAADMFGLIRDEISRRSDNSEENRPVYK